MKSVYRILVPIFLLVASTSFAESVNFKSWVQTGTCAPGYCYYTWVGAGSQDQLRSQELKLVSDNGHLKRWQADDELAFSGLFECEPFVIVKAVFKKFKIENIDTNQTTYGLTVDWTLKKPFGGPILATKSVGISLKSFDDYSTINFKSPTYSCYGKLYGRTIDAIGELVYYPDTPKCSDCTVDVTTPISP